MTAAVAGMDVNVYQFKVFNPAVVNPSEQATISTLAIDFQVVDNVSFSVEIAGKLVVIIPSDSPVDEVMIVEVDVGLQIDGIVIIGCGTILIFTPQIAQGDKVIGGMDIYFLALNVEARRRRASVPHRNLVVSQGCDGRHGHQQHG